MNMSVILDAENPWPGLESYHEAGQDFFKGRNAEVKELARLVSVSHLVAVYGKSGVGKTSLLQAGLFPRLRAAYYLPVFIRLEHSDAAPLASEQIANELFKALTDVAADFPALAVGESLWAYLHRKNLVLWSKDNYPLQLVFVIDQFEEIFTLGAKYPERQKQNLLELSCLFENFEPPEIANLTHEARGHLELREQKHCCLLSFREDYLPDVKIWGQGVPNLLRRELRLLPMDRATAVAAVQEAGQAVLAPNVAQDIVTLISKQGKQAESQDPVGQTIEPVLLSLTCDRLNKRRAYDAATQTRKLIDTELVQQEGLAILEDFYREALQDQPVALHRFIEERLIHGRFRGNYPKDEAIASGYITPSQLDFLTQDHRLLRVVHHLDGARIELIHDRLVPIVAKAKERCEAEEALAAEQQRVQAERQKKRRLMWALFGALALFIAALWFGWQASLSEQKARESANQAIEAKQEAESQTKLAQERAELLVKQQTELEEKQVKLEAEQTKTEGALRLAQEETQKAKIAENTARGNALDANILRWVAEAPAMISGEQAGGQEQGLLKLLATHRVAQQHRPAMVAKSFAPMFAVEQALQANRSVRLWTHKTPVTSTAYSPDGRWVVFADGDNLLHLWDIKSRQLLGPPWRGHDYGVRSVSFSPDGKYVVSGGYDKTLRLWRVLDGWTEAFCARLTRNMSREEWREWIAPDVPYACQCPGLPVSPDGDRWAKPQEFCPAPYQSQPQPIHRR